jgi:hypothetical protein
MCVQEVKSLQMENESLKLTLDKVQVQLDTSLDAQVNKYKLIFIAAQILTKEQTMFN